MPPRSSRAAFAFAVLVASCSVLLARPDRAGDILARAREAIGGEARLKAVTSLSLTAASQSDLDGSRRALTDVRIDIALPDRFVEERNWPRSFLRRAAGFNGDRLIDQRWSAGGTWRDAHVGETDKEVVRRTIALRQRECVRYLVAWLLMAPERYHVRFTDAGEADSPQGRVDVIAADGANDFGARLFFDKQTHRLLTITWEEPPPSGGAVGAASPATPGSLLFKSIEGPASKGLTKMQGTGYRAEAGILFPHLVTIEMDGLMEEWHVSRFKVNAPPDAKRFDKR
jgi:hypothetical protein